MPGQVRPPNLPQQPQPPQGLQQQQRGPGMTPLERQLNQPPNAPNEMKPGQREIWKGNLQWKNPKSDSSQEQAMHSLLCKITSAVNAANESVVKSDNWPDRLIMQLIPKSLVSQIGKLLKISGV